MDDWSVLWLTVQTLKTIRINYCEVSKKAKNHLLLLSSHMNLIGKKSLRWDSCALLTVVSQFAFVSAGWSKVKTTHFLWELMLLLDVAGELMSSVMGQTWSTSCQTGQKMSRCPWLWAPLACQGETDVERMDGIKVWVSQRFAYV